MQSICEALNFNSTITTLELRGDDADRWIRRAFPIEKDNEQRTGWDMKERNA